MKANMIQSFIFLGKVLGLLWNNRTGFFRKGKNLVMILVLEKRGAAGDKTGSQTIINLTPEKTPIDIRTNQDRIQIPVNYRIHCHLFRLSSLASRNVNRTLICLFFPLNELSKWNGWLFLDLRNTSNPFFAWDSKHRAKDAVIWSSLTRIQTLTTQVQRDWEMWSASILRVVVVIKPINITAVQVNGSPVIKPTKAADIILRFTLPQL